MLCALSRSAKVKKSHAKQRDGKSKTAQKMSLLKSQFYIPKRLKVIVFISFSRKKSRYKSIILIFT